MVNLVGAGSSQALRRLDEGKSVSVDIDANRGNRREHVASINPDPRGTTRIPMWLECPDTQAYPDPLSTPP